MSPGTRIDNNLCSSKGIFFFMPSKVKNNSRLLKCHRYNTGTLKMPLVTLGQRQLITTSYKSTK